MQIDQRCFVLLFSHSTGQNKTHSDGRSTVVNQRNAVDLENDLLTLRERYNELAEYSNNLKFELENARKQIHERSLLERESVRYF